MFHVSLLKPYHLAKVSGKESIDLGKVLVDAEEVVPSDEYLPQTIHGSAHKRRKEKIEILYWIEWADYPDKSDFTWEPYEHLRDSSRAQELLVQFHHDNSEKLRHAKVCRA